MTQLQNKTSIFLDQGALFFARNIRENIDAGLFCA
jgi:ABC-type transporter Mla maintaining outer membrane lipid asymmetry ATPase subunit MlaF